MDVLLQETLNPPLDNKLEIKRGKITYREGDKVIQTVNNYSKNVFNGDIGMIERITKKIDEETGKWAFTLHCKINGEDISYTEEEMKQLQLAYSITVHKSQGGQAKIVIMPMSTSHYIMLARNLLYTGITRAEERVVLIGTEKALNIAIQNNRITERYTGLAEKVESYMKYGQDGRSVAASSL